MEQLLVISAAFLLFPFSCSCKCLLTLSSILYYTFLPSTTASHPVYNSHINKKKKRERERNEPNLRTEHSGLIYLHCLSDTQIAESSEWKAGCRKCVLFSLLVQLWHSLIYEHLRLFIYVCNVSSQSRCYFSHTVDIILIYFNFFSSDLLQNADVCIYLQIPSWNFQYSTGNNFLINISINYLFFQSL